MRIYFYFIVGCMLGGCAETIDRHNQASLTAVSKIIELPYGASEKEVSEALGSDGILGCWFRVGDENYHSRSFYFSFREPGHAYESFEYEALFNHDSLIAFSKKENICDCLDEQCYLDKLQNITRERLSREQLLRDTENMNKSVTDARQKTKGQQSDGSLEVLGTAMTDPYTLGVGVALALPLIIAEAAYYRPTKSASCAKDWIDGIAKANMLTLGSSYTETLMIVASWGYYWGESSHDDKTKIITVESKNGCPHMILTISSNNLLSVKIIKYM